MIDARLDPRLMPVGDFPLARLGRANDGGYLVDERTISTADALLSFGIEFDWSFEQQFVARNDVPVSAFDPTIGTRRFLAMSIEGIWRRKSAHYALWALTRCARYIRFFRGKRKHFKLWIGRNRIGLSEALDLHEESVGSVFLKIDIEGAEYALLDDLVILAPKFVALAIEFHDVPAHLEAIAKFVDAFPLSVCHVHANNFAGLDDAGHPNVLEMSFSAMPPTGPFEGPLPHALDQPNDVTADEYRIVTPT